MAEEEREKRTFDDAFDDQMRCFSTKRKRAKTLGRSAATLPICGRHFVMKSMWCRINRILADLMVVKGIGSAYSVRRCPVDSTW